ncbi:MAG: sulfite exporter TauE/SafE family protein [Victivallales bacterium]|jgi:uncharacterized membrane protein YfcA|nr:sulfite exporter TauE/SafE family protein [Victivallales bacterium]
MNTLWVAGPLIGLIGMMSGGFWGVGCGWIVVPTMLILGFDPLDAVGIGLLQMVPSTIPTVVRQFPEIGWQVNQPGRVLVIPLAVGAIGASLFGKMFNEELFQLFGGAGVLQWMLAAFILVIALQTACSHTLVNADEFPAFSTSKKFGVFGVGAVTGVLSSMLGVGGGLLMRPVLTSGFKIPEYFTSRIVRLMVTLTTLSGGITYLFHADAVVWPVLWGAILVSLGGFVGFPLGTWMHKIAFDAGYAQHIHKSFSIPAGAMFVNTILNVTGFREISRVAMVIIALGVAAGLIGFTRYAGKHPRNII